MKAVHEDDLVRFLKSLGVYELVCSEEATCHICKANITLDNLGAVFPYKGEIEFCCDNPVCIIQAQGVIE